MVTGAVVGAKATHNAYVGLALFADPQKAARALVLLLAIAGAGCGRGRMSSEAPHSTSTKAVSGPPKAHVAAAAVTSGVFCQPEGAPDLKSFAIYAEKSARLDPGVVVKGGNVGVKDSTGPYLHEDFAMTFMPDAKVQPGTTYAASMLLESGSAASEIGTNRLVDRGGSHGTVTAFPPMGPLPSVPGASYGTKDLVVENHKSLDLAATAQYQSIQVRSTGVLRLEGGLYQVGTLSVEAQARLEILAPVELRIATQLDVGSQAYFGPAAGVTLTARDLFVAFSGSDGDGTWPVRFDAQTVARTVVLAPAATIHLQPEVILTGALVGRFIWAGPNTQINFEAGIAGCITPCGNSNPWDDGNPCTADSCDLVKGVLHTPVVDGAACDDGNACTQTDSCVKGTCVGAKPVVCPAPDQCHLLGVCDTKTGECSNPAKPDHTTCDDGDACTQQDTCEEGACIGAAPKVCVPSDDCHNAGECDVWTGVCSNPPKQDGADCSDGNACNGAETCAAGECRQGTPPVVDDGNPCTADSCDAGTGVKHTPLPAGVSCSDGNACNGDEKCDGLGACLVGTAPPASDGNPCTTDSCDPATGVQHTPVAAGTPCPDSNPCNGNETCNASGTCLPGAPPVVDDGNPCTTDSCDPSQGVQHVPLGEGTACSDGNVCHGPGKCNAASTCVFDAPPPTGTGNGALGRTQWEMSQGEGLVFYGFTSPTYGDQSEYAFCTIPPAGDASWGPAPNGNVIGYSVSSTLCGAANCRAAGQFTYFQTLVTVPQNVQVNTFTIAFTGVDDGVRTTIFNSDHPNGAVVPGSYVYLGGSGTANLAALVKSGEVNRVVVTHVDDCCSASYLSSAQVVLNGTTLPVAPPAWLDDGNPCTIDSCDPVTGIHHTPVGTGTSCSDGNVCNGDERCSADGICSPGTPPSIEDGNPCTSDSCNPVTGPIHTLVPPGTSCSDGNACNGEETCDGTGLCVLGAPPIVNDGNPCTADSCDADAGVVHTPLPQGVPCGIDRKCSPAGTCDVQTPSPCFAPPQDMANWWAADGSTVDRVGLSAARSYGNVLYESGAVRQAFGFDGLGAYVEATEPPRPNPESLTLDAWVFPQTLAGVQTIAAKRLSRDSSTTMGWVLRTENGTGRLFLGVYQTASIFRAATTNSPVLQLEVWQHVAGSFDANTQSLRIFVDGVEAPSAVLAGSAPEVRFSSVVNGDFALGNVGFTSDYIYSPGDLGPAGVYEVLPNPHRDHGLFSPCADHTGGGGNMLVANGAGSSTQQVWCETIPVLTGTTYEFSAWGTSVYPGSPAILNFSVNGNVLGNDFALTSTTCAWQRFYQRWSSESSDSAQICVIDLNTVAGGNDFALDDIFFRSLAGASIRIGAQFGDSNIAEEFWRGRIDETEVFDRALRGDEISALFAAGSSGKCLPSNRAPRVFAGDDSTASLPRSFSLLGTVADDGLPLGSVLTREWTKVSGPGEVTFTDPNSESTTVTFSAPGAYVLRLTASDGELTAYDDMAVTAMLGVPNQPPVANAGPDQVVRLPGSATLAGNAADDGLPTGSSLTVTWSKVSGPGEVVFADPHAASTTVTFSVSGLYVLRLTASDGELTSQDDVSADVNSSGPANVPPTVTASTSPTADLATGADLHGTASDDGLPSGILVTIWSKVSGPGAVTVTNAGALDTHAMFSAIGNYTLRLTASDGALEAHQDVQISVTNQSLPNQPPVVEAGSDLVVKMPGPGMGVPAEVRIVGSYTDDGLPVGGHVTITWGLLSGDGTQVHVVDFNALPLEAAFSGPGEWELMLLVDDGELQGYDTVKVTIQAPDNRAPVVSAGADLNLALAFGGGPATGSLDGSFTDDGLPDGQTPSSAWSQKSGPTACAISDPTSLRPTITCAAAGSYTFLLEVTDGVATGHDEVLVTVVPAAINQPPAIEVGPDQEVQLPQASVILNCQVTDDGLPSISALSFTWSAVSGPGPVTFADAHACPTVATFVVPGMYALQLSATDTLATTTRTVSVYVWEAPDGTAPEVAITAPTEESSVTGLLRVKGSAVDANLESWKVEQRAQGAASWTTIATGTQSVSDGDLADFDPTLLINGIYELRLTAVDKGRLTAETTVAFLVEGNQKVGNFTVSFKDLSVPVAGIPIEVIRTYDSRNKVKGDFGVGWTLDINTTKVQKNRQLGVLWQGTVECGDQWCITQKYCIAERRPHVITITFSDGKVFKFKPTLSPNCQAAPPATVNVSFQPMPGTTASLASTNGAAALVDGTFEDGYVTPIELRDQENGDFFDPTKFRLTLHDGRVLDLDQATGLEKVTDLNGNMVEIKATGIESSNGRSVTFTRDAEGRITGITDPASNTLGYTYDAAGDLVAFLDLAGSTTRYAYDASHFLLGIRDARGIEPIQNQYDASGRLLSHTDATGATITYTHDLVAQTEKVCDRLSHCTTHSYDDRGNVVVTEDALGNKTTYEYDERDNKTKECNALGQCTSYTYDAADNKLGETDPLGNTTLFTYDGLGNVTSTTDPLGHVTSNSYDGHGNLAETHDPAGNVTTYTYGAKGLQTSMTDALGNATSYSYDEGGVIIKGTGDLLSETDALGHKTEYEYDARGNRTKQTKTRTRGDGTVETLVTLFAYDGAGRLVSTTMPDGSTTSTEYNSIGQQSATVDALGRRTERTYDDMGRLVKTKYPDGTEEGTEYDAEGHRTASIDRAGRRTTFAYDEVGRLLATTLPDGNTTSTTYDAAGRAIATTDEDGRMTTSVYDDAGRRRRVIDPLGNATVFEFDKAGRQTKVTDPAGHVTRYVYDALGRRTQTIFDDGSIEATTYDALGRRTGKQDQAGVATSYQYDALGRLVGVVDANGKQTVYGYDEIGNQVTKTDAVGHVTRFEYDSSGRRTKRTLPLTSAGLASETMAYNLGGQLVGKTDFMGRTTGMTYDLAGRLTSKTYPDGAAVEFTYTPTGRRANAKDSRGVTTYSYDPRDRLTEMAYPDGRKLTYKWGCCGERSEMTAVVAGQSLTTKWGYDGAGRLNRVTDARGGTYALDYDVDGLRTGLTQPNGTQTSYGYGALHRLKELRTMRTADASVVQSYKYTVGPTGIRTNIEEADGTTRAYGYDLLYRLVTEKITGTAGATLDYEKAFIYDDVGNRLHQATTGFSAATIDYGHDERDRLLTEIATDTTTYGWDENGNMTSKSGTDGAVYTWDFDDRMVKVIKVDGSAAEYTYDVDGVRVRTVEKDAGGVVTAVHDYLVDTSGGLSHVVAETDGAGALAASYVRAGDQLLAEIKGDGSVRYYHTDGLGSVRVLTGADGAVTDGYGYTAFGEALGWTGNDAQPYRFAGEEWSSQSGMQYHRARWYAPRSAAFSSRDPSDGRRSDPASLRGYSYAHLDPASKSDPLGLFTLADIAVTSAILGEVAVGSAVEFGDIYESLNRKGECGREVAPAVDDTLNNIASAFQGWNRNQKCAACGALFEVDWSALGSAPGQSISSLQAFPLVDAWDIKELARRYPGYAIPSNGKIVWPPDFKFNTVGYRGKCYAKGSVNYSMWGRINSLCYSEQILPWLTNFSTTMALYEAYKYGMGFREIYEEARFTSITTKHQGLPFAIYGYTGWFFHSAPYVFAKMTSSSPAAGVFGWRWSDQSGP